MAKNPQNTIAPTKKHQARLEREKQQIRWVIIGTIVVLALAIGSILLGVIYEQFIKPSRTIANVNGDIIRVKEFQNQVRFSRSALIQNAQQTAQFMQLFQEDANTMASLASQLQQIQSQLDKVSVGSQVIDRLTDNLLISQEAERRGIKVSDADVEKEFKNLLGYYPEGTPTPKPTLELMPTSTFSPLQLTAIAPTATAVITSTASIEDTAIITATSTLEPTPTSLPEVSEPVTPTATLEPTTTPTPYTEEGYQEQYKGVLTNYADFGVPEKDLKYVVLSQLITEKVRNAVLEEIEISKTREEVWARHILVDDEQVAKDIIVRLENGEDWCKIASELSTDTSNKDLCGDLSWFPKGQMVPEFEDAAFTLPVGEISDPIKTEFGWHILWVLGHEDKPLSSSDFEQLQQTKFDEWLANLRETSTITIDEYWKQIVPDEPGLPLEILQIINQFSQSAQPQLPVEGDGGSAPTP